MLRSYRGIVVAFAGLVLACIYQPNEGRAAEAPAEHAQEQVAQAPQIVPRAEPSRSTTPTPNLTSGPRDQSYYDREDLKAQRDMAKWTRIMGIAAVIGVALSVVGVGLVWTTFRETRAANDIATKEQRPWVDVEIGGVKMASSATSFNLTVDIRLTNLGKSPALNVRSRARIVTSRGKGEPLRGEFFPGEDYTRTTHNLLPGGAGEDSLHPKVEADNIAMATVFMGKGKLRRQVAGPNFVPTLEVVIDYEWGVPLRPGKTVKHFTISEVHEHWHFGDRVAIPIHLGQTPLPKLTSFQHGIAEIT